MAAAWTHVIALYLNPQNDFGLRYSVAVHGVSGHVPALCNGVRPGVRRSRLRPIRRGADLSDGAMMQPSCVPHGRLSLADTVAYDTRMATQPELLAAPLRQVAENWQITVIVDLASRTSQRSRWRCGGLSHPLPRRAE